MELREFFRFILIDSTELVAIIIEFNSISGYQHIPTFIFRETLPLRKCSGRHFSHERAGQNWKPEGSNYNLYKLSIFFSSIYLEKTYFAPTRSIAWRNSLKFRNPLLSSSKTLKKTILKNPIFFGKMVLFVNRELILHGFTKRFETKFERYEVCKNSYHLYICRASDITKQC